MTETPIFILAVVLLVTLLPLGWLARLRRARHAQNAVQMARFEQRLLHPNYAAFKSHYGFEPPVGIRKLYEDRETVLGGEFEIRLPSSRHAWPVACFEPMEDGSWVGVDGFYSFANDGYGNLYLVSLPEADPQVFFLDHETGEREALGVRLSEFLTAKQIK